MIYQMILQKKRIETALGQVDRSSSRVKPNCFPANLFFLENFFFSKNSLVVGTKYTFMLGLVVFVPGEEGYLTRGMTGICRKPLELYPVAYKTTLNYTLSHNNFCQKLYMIKYNMTIFFRYVTKRRSF